MRVSYCEVILEGKNREYARVDLISRGLLSADDRFVGPAFEVGVRGCTDLFLQYHAAGVTVTVHSGADAVDYFYSYHTVARVKSVR